MLSCRPQGERHGTSLFRDRYDIDRARTGSGKAMCRALQRHLQVASGPRDLPVEILTPRHLSFAPATLRPRSLPVPGRCIGAIPPARSPACLWSPRSAISNYESSFAAPVRVACTLLPEESFALWVPLPTPGSRSQGNVFAAAEGRIPQRPCRNCLELFALARLAPQGTCPAVSVAIHSGFRGRPFRSLPSICC